MSRVFLILYFSLFLSNSSSFAQENPSKKQLSNITFSEKIYIQLSSTVYTTDQIIWFKAIVTDVNKVPTVLSDIIQIELINSDKRIIDKKLIKLENGIANSYFDLKENLPLKDGRYMIRAYTKWNKNFEGGFIFKQYISLFKPRKVKIDEEIIRDVIITEDENKQLELSAKIYSELLNAKYKGKLMLKLNLDGIYDSIEIKKGKKNNYYSFNYLLPKGIVKAKMDLHLEPKSLKNNNLLFLNSYSKTVVINKDLIDLQFFPEGGKLINGLESVLAFKALDYKNEGIKVSGKIIDESGMIIKKFKSNDLGMGTFKLISDINKKYTAEITNNNIKYKYQLPQINNTGYVLTAKTINDYFRIQIVSNFSKSDNLILKVQARGINYHIQNVKSKKGKVDIAIDRKTLPEGIITITAFDNQNTPICERLLFNYKENKRIQISTKTNKKRFSQRDKVVFDIITKYSDSSHVKTNTSFLVINKNQLEKMQLKRNNILTYFLLQSELKGTIEQPNYYFDTNNKYRFYAMDALLLTQGWRNYLYKPTKINRPFLYKPQKKLEISGTVGQYINQKKKKPLELTLLSLGKEKIQFANTHVDSLGRFSFYLQDTYNDDLEYIIQTKDYKGKKKSYTINIDKDKSPEIHFAKLQKVQLPNKFSTYVAENIKRFNKENPFNLDNNVTTLDEIKITTRLLTKKQKEINEEHGKPDVVIENKELLSKVKKWSYGLYSILRFNYQKDIEIRRGGRNKTFVYANVYGADFTFVLVDGYPVNLRHYNLLKNLPPEEIRSIEIIKNPKNSRKYFYDVFERNDPGRVKGLTYFSFLNIYTYSKKGLFGVQSTKGIFKNTLPSFAVKREFYAPKHKKLVKSDWDLPDLRSVVFWEPNVKFNDSGIGKVTFYNDDNIGEQLVIIESISKNGDLGYYQTTYNVNKKLVK